VASHVVEHVPDIISWLAEIAEVLVDGGQLLLVIPDRRFTFDILRPSTTVGQMLQSHELRETRPSVRAVYDMFHSAVTVGAGDAWEGAVPGPEDRRHSLAETTNQVQRTRNGGYVDCHVWTFTPESFVEQIAELGALELCDLVVETIVSTAQNDIEFYAVLRRLPRGASGEELTATRTASVVEVSDAGLVRYRTQIEIGRLAAENAALHTEVENSVVAAGQRTKELEDSVVAAGQRTKELEDELARVKASERWRLGGLAAITAAAVKRLLVR
jgi:hypothetical protein